jgi:hypothetical protein
MANNTKYQKSFSDDEEKVLINFRIPVSFRKEFRIAAAQLDMTQSDLLQLIFEEWKQKQHKG